MEQAFTEQSFIDGSIFKRLAPPIHWSIALVAMLVTAWCDGAHADIWLPITPEELALRSEPNAPNASAIILYRQVDRDDNAPGETNYTRIKILTDEGRKYGDVEIQYDKSREQVRNIQARTIRPDGSIVNFNGTIFDKPIMRGNGLKILAKTFTLPEVQVGSIIEYRFRDELASGYIFDSHWILSQELFTKHGKYSLNPYNGFNLRYSWPAGLPPGTDLPKKVHDKIFLETYNVPAFVTEEHMPPPDELKYRVDFIYSDDPSIEKNPIDFWKKFGKQRYKDVEKFIDKRQVMQEAVAQIVDASDSPETKVRKIYARTQQIRNSSFERSKSQQETQREAQKDAKNVADVWKREYGDGLQITWLFLGLVRAAGIDADPVLVSTRDVYFFNEQLMNSSQLNSNVVRVKYSGKELYLDPGTALAPFGLLPWNETAVSGLLLDKNGGTWVTTPLPASPVSRIDRKVHFKLDTDGTLEGKVAVAYTGLEALWRRLEERHEDDADRKQFLEDQLRADIPSGIDVTLTNQPVWDRSELTLVAEYDVKIPGWGAGAGQRMLLPIGLFGNRDKNTFARSTREYALYFNFPNKTMDDITIDLPAGLQVNSLPATHNSTLDAADYSIAVLSKNGPLEIRRELTMDMLLLKAKAYPTLRNFFQAVRTGDEDQVVITPIKALVRH